MTRSTLHPFPHVTRRQLMAGMAGVTATSMLPAASWAQDRNVLRLRLYQEPGVYDPIDGAGFPDEALYGCIYRKLIQYAPGKEWGYQLDLAETIEQTSPTTIGFTLRPKQMWSDGYGEITAEDIKFSLERIVDPEMNSRIRPDLGSFTHVELTGTHSGIIHMKEPFAPIWTIALPYLAGNVLSKKATEEVGGRLTTAVPPTVAGPYRVVEQRTGERWVLERNPEYSGPSADFDRVDIVGIVDDAAAEIAKETGGVDFSSVGPSAMARLQDDLPANTRLTLNPSLRYQWIGINMGNPKFADLKVRQAIQHAIDLPSILQASYFDMSKPATGIIAPGLIGHREAAQVPPAADFERVRSLLDEAGIDRLEVTLSVLNDVTSTTTAQVLQAMMEPVGIDLAIDVQESGSFWGLGVKSDGDRWKTLELTMKSFSMTPDPYYATAWFTTDMIGDWNWEQFSSEEFDQLHLEAVTETDPDRRDEMYRRMQDLMEESGCYRFITHPVIANLSDTDIVPALRPDGSPLVQFFSLA